MNCNVIDRKKVENFSSFILKTTFKSDGGGKLSSINCSIFFTFTFDFHLLSFLVVCSCVYLLCIILISCRLFSSKEGASDLFTR